MLRVVLRTCDKASLRSNRIVNKRECVIRCLNSILTNLRELDDVHLHIIDDNSSQTLRDSIRELTKDDTFVDYHFIDGNPYADAPDPRKVSRHSVKIAYDYIYSLDENDMVYVVEDDYLHKADAISKYLTTWQYLNNITSPDLEIGIFTQCFPQLFYLPGSQPQMNDVYLKHCDVVPTPTGWYRTTWYTHESFMIRSKVFKKYKQHFDEILKIGDDPAYWEGNTFCAVWNKQDVKMFMPLDPNLMHMSSSDDVPFYSSREDVERLWEENKTFLSSEQDSQVVWSQENLQMQEKQ